MKNYTYLLLVFLGINFSYAQGNQEDLKPYRVGLKIGAPTVIGLNFEYVTPLWENRVAPFIDYSNLKYNNDGDIYRSYVFEIGANVYFNDDGNGKGFYGGLSYGNINFKMDRLDYKADNGMQFTGVAKSKSTVNSFNVKVGAKVGDKFYFRTELGYGFGAIPEGIESTGIINGTGTTIVEDISEDLKDIPFVSANGSLLFNIGFGYEFK